MDIDNDNSDSNYDTEILNNNGNNISTIDDANNANSNNTNTNSNANNTNLRMVFPRRRSSASTGAASINSVNSSICGNGHMSELEQEERRKQIQQIMQDTTLSQREKGKQIQALMDGRQQSQQQNHRRSSLTSVGSEDGSIYSAYYLRVAAAQQQQQQLQQSVTSIQQQDDTENTDTIMSEAALAAVPNNNNFHQYRNNNNNGDDRSVASSVTSYETSSQNLYYDAGGGGGVDEQQQQQEQIPAGRYRQIHGRSYSLQDWGTGGQIHNDHQNQLMMMQLQNAAASASIGGGGGTDNNSSNTNKKHNIGDINRLMETSRPVCEHYERNCTMIAPCCNLAFGCRICHDECPVLPPPITTQNHLGIVNTQRRHSLPLHNYPDHDHQEETHHLIDRFAVIEIICRKCYTRQNSKTNNCSNCGIQFGEYHCNICNLWMSKKEQPYHCTECGFCRVGGRDNFRHCSDCGMCIDAQLFDDHNCKSGKYMSNCPICQEDLFSSRFASHEMPCGHAIHWHCFKELTSYDTRCPVCKKTAESPDQMAATWSAIAMGIALQPVPADMARVVNITCNDCESADTNRRWHFLGVRCTECLSFNTNVDRIVMQGRDAAAFLDRLESNNNNNNNGGGGGVNNDSGVPANISMPTIQLRDSTLHSDSSSSSSHSDSDNIMEDVDDDNSDTPGAMGTSAGSSGFTPPRY